jgi:type IV pilus assembly protein PilE
MRRVRAYTLIELMIVITIIAVLAVIAIAGYLEYAQRAQRVDATAALTHAASRQADVLNQTQRYTADWSVLGYDGALTEHGYYELSFDVAPDTRQYRILATPVAGAGQDQDADCQWFTIDQRGRTASGPEDCW